MPDLNSILIGGFAIAPLVVAIVNLVKRLGVPAEYAQYVNGGVSAVLWVTATYVLPLYPELQPYVIAVVGTVVVFLGASGIHKFGKITKR